MTIVLPTLILLSQYLRKYRVWPFTPYWVAGSQDNRNAKCCTMHQIQRAFSRIQLTTVSVE